MITEDYVSFETAKLLKEKGFDEPFFFFYRTDDEVKKIHHAYVPKSYHLKYTDDEIVNALTHQRAMKWLREVHGVYIEIPIVGMEWETPTKWYFGWRCQTKDVIDRLRSKDANYTSYEEAVEAAIKYSLENLI